MAVYSVHSIMIGHYHLTLLGLPIQSGHSHTLPLAISVNTTKCFTCGGYLYLLAASHPASTICLHAHSYMQPLECFFHLHTVVLLNIFNENGKEIKEYPKGTTI